MLYQYSIGVAVLPDKIAAVAIKSGFKGIHTAAHAAVAFDGEPQPAGKVKLIAEVVADLIQNHRLGEPDIYLAIPRGSVIVRDINLPLAVRENLRRSLEYEMTRYVPLPVEEIYFDYQIVEEDRQANLLRLLLFVVKKRDLDPYLTLPAFLGRPLSGIEVEATAMSRYLSAHTTAENGRPKGLLRFGRENGELSIYRRQALSFNKMIQYDADADPAAVFTEALRAPAGSHGETLSLQEASFYCYARDASLQARLNGRTDFACEVLDGAAVGLPSPDMIPAYGLALRGARDPRAGINLLPLAQRKKPSRASYYTILALVFLTFFFGLTWGAGSLVRHRMAVAELDRQLRQLHSQVSEVEQLGADIAAVEKQLALIDGLRQKSLSSLVVMRELSTRIPRSAWVQELHLKSDGVQITGVADAAGELLEVLEGSPLFKEAVFLSAITKTKENRERFRIGLAFE